MTGITRRTFLRTLTLAGGAAAVAPALLRADAGTNPVQTPTAAPPSSLPAPPAKKWVTIGKLADYPVGHVAKVPVSTGAEKSSIFVSRIDDKTLKVFSAICPHRLCVINYDADAKYFQCPCHRARFDKFGQVLRGPAPSPLTPIPTRIEKDVIWVAPDVPKPPLLDDEDD